MLVKNAIIMAAGTSSRFAPLSYEKHKALIEVKGEILIERQIKQIKEAGIKDIYIVTGYKAEQFDYLKDKYSVKLIHNSEYLTRNNNGSIWAVRDILGDSYICSSDNYFAKNPFETEVEDSYYAAEYAEDHTEEWCMTEDSNGYINSVVIGGEKAWYMLGHTFWSQDFAKKFLSILKDEYNKEETKGKLWEKIFMAHLDTLKMKIRKYEPDVIYEFDTLDELRTFDNSYITDTRSEIIKEIVKQLNVNEKDIINIKRIESSTNEAGGFMFDCMGSHYTYNYETKELNKTN